MPSSTPSVSAPSDAPLHELKPTPVATGPVMGVNMLREGAQVPAYQTPGSAGMDIHALLDAKPNGNSDVIINPMQILVVPTGLAIAIPDGYEGQVRPRSGLATKHGISVPNAPGTIDSDYRGELKIALINLGREPFLIETGMRIAQLIIAPVAQVRIEQVTAFDATQRGSGGFGSTGV